MPPKNKDRITYVCTECGEGWPKWSGRCDACGAWSSLKEMHVPAEVSARGLGKTAGSGGGAPVRLGEVASTREARIGTGMNELDRVLGGGIVPGSLILIGGDPGIGKSTLLLQMMVVLAAADISTLYVSGEESLTQIKLRAERLETPSPSLLVLAETNLDQILAQAAILKPQVLVIDSIQTVYKPELQGSPGSPTQLRECTMALMVHAKSTGCAVVIVGHVTKEGVLAGPRMLEHMVDTVVYFEGERQHAYRLLRSVKNRFGATNEIGVFEMSSGGLLQVENPSAVFVQNRAGRDPGSIVSCSMEGTRPILVELQALVAKTNFAMPQRVAMGLDGKRLTILLALLDKFAGIEIGPQDVFVAVAGGFRVDETAVDLAIAAAVAGNHLGKSTRPSTLVLGELGLNGEVRMVPQMEARIKEALRLGFKTIVLPQGAAKKVNLSGADLLPIQRLDQAFERLFE